MKTTCLMSGVNRRQFLKDASAAAVLTVLAGCGDERKAISGKGSEMTDMTFNALIEARRSVRAYAPSEISREELVTIVTAVIALGKSAQPYFKNPRKPVDEVLSLR